MSEGRAGVFTGGAALTWRRQRVLWWPFLVNLVLAHFAAHVTMERAGWIIERSLASERLLVHGFHLSALVELMSGPANRLSFGPEGLVFGFVFFFFMLLATGGILESYWRDATLTTTEFFQNGGKYFWRFLRLVIFLLIALIPVGIIGTIGSSIADRVDAKSISPFPTVWITAATAFVVLLLLMIVRLWFDIAEVTAVARRRNGGLALFAGGGAGAVWQFREFVLAVFPHQLSGLAGRGDSAACLGALCQTGVGEYFVRDGAIDCFVLDGDAMVAAG